MNATSFKLERVRLSYNDLRDVNGLSLSVCPGGIFVSTGPSGCGKPRVQRAVSGRWRPDGGGARAQDDRTVALGHAGELLRISIDAPDPRGDRPRDGVRAEIAEIIAALNYSEAA